MAVIGVGKSDLSSVTSEKEPRIQGRQEQATGEGTSSLNTESTKSNTEKKEEKAPESFSLASSGYGVVAEGQLAAEPGGPVAHLAARRQPDQPVDRAPPAAAAAAARLGSIQGTAAAARVDAV